MSDMRYYDGAQWISLKGEPGGGGVTQEQVDASIDAALDPYLLIADFNATIANYATKADLSAYMTQATADGRYVRLQPGGAKQTIAGPIDIVGDLTTGNSVVQYENAISRSGPYLESRVNYWKNPNLAGIVSKSTDGAAAGMFLEINGPGAQLHIGNWDQANDHSTVVMSRYVNFTQGLLNASNPATLKMDTETGVMIAGDFVAERGVETVAGPNKIRGVTFFGAQGLANSADTSILAIRPSATPNIIMLGSGLELRTTISNFTNAQQPLHRNATTNLVGYFSSSRTFKTAIREGGDLADNTLAVEPVHFYFNEEMYQEGDPHYEQMGFIAEDVVAAYGPGAGVYGGEDGSVVIDYSERPILAGLVALCQRQEAQIKDLETRLAVVEGQKPTAAVATTTDATATDTTTTTTTRKSRTRKKG